jgi:hypothetical protein
LKKLPCAFLAVALLSSIACERMLTQSRKTVYVPWEEGLTLVYEDPTLPTQAERFQNRLQRRVSAAKETPQGKRVTITYSTLKSNQALDFLSQDGGWALMQGDTPLFTMLPEGFPDRVDQWEDKNRGLTFHVIGRAVLQNPNLTLPHDFDRIGVWVEMESKNGPRQRIFFLPGIGEAESQVFQDGKWVMVNQLVSRGFTDAPAVKTDEKAP